MKKISLMLIAVLLLVGCSKNENTNSNENLSNRNETSNISNVNSNFESNSNINSNSNLTSNETIKYDESKVGTNRVTLYLFYLSTCPHCHDEMEWLNTIENKYSYLDIVKYEVYQDSELYEKVVEKMNINDYHVPLTIIGNDYTIGYSQSKNDTFIDLIKKHSSYDSCDVVKAIKDGKDIEKCMKK